jgi:hypothetical protein|tara:strand:+ start:2534 stop:3121 length:588 start_codon:yes stop_codon:yes gene_type:complete
VSKLRNRQIQQSRGQSTYFPFEGGVNITDPAMSLEPGELIAADNFEIDLRGRYSRVEGYERFDGQTLPSEITLYRIPFIAGTARDSVFSMAFGTAFDMQIPAIGDLIKGETSGAVGLVLSVSVEDITGDDEAGAFSITREFDSAFDRSEFGRVEKGDAEGYVYFRVRSGTLQDGETLFFLNQNSAFGSAFNVEYK